MRLQPRPSGHLGGIQLGVGSNGHRRHPHGRLMSAQCQRSGALAEHETSSETRLADGRQVRVDKYRGRVEAVIEASVPVLLRGDNREPASASEVMDAVTHLHAEASQYVEWLQGPDELDLQRLDLVRDFVHVPRAHELLAEISKCPAPRTTTWLWRNPACSGVADALPRN